MAELTISGGSNKLFLGQGRPLTHLGQGRPLTHMFRWIKLKRLVHGRLQKIIITLDVSCRLDSHTGSLSEFQSHGQLTDCITKYFISYFRELNKNIL